MKPFSLLLTLLGISLTTVFGQKMVIGSIIDVKSKKPLPEVNLQIDNSYDGGLSDPNGKFQFATEEDGKIILLVYKNTFDTLRIPIDLTNRATIDLGVIQLTHSATYLQEVIIRTKKKVALEANMVEVSPLDVATTGGSASDITNMLTTLPGVQSTGTDPGMAVRGGDVYETKQFMDGSYVSNPYPSGTPNTSQRNRMNPFIFKQMSFSSGGYSALYGQALSAALIMNSIDMPKSSNLDISVSPLFAGFGATQLSKNKQSAWMLNYGYTDLNWYYKWIKQRFYYGKKPQSQDLTGALRFKTKGGGMIKYYTSFSASDVQVDQPIPDTNAFFNGFKVKNYYWFNNLNWNQSFANQWKAFVSLGFSFNQEDIHSYLTDANHQPVASSLPYTDSMNFRFFDKSPFAQGRVVMTKRFTPNVELQFGGEYWYTKYNSQYRIYGAKLKNEYCAGYAELTYDITSKLQFVPGVRYEYASIMHQAKVAPRLNLSYALAPKQSLTASYGIFYQMPEYRYLAYSNDLKQQKATHYQLTYSYLNGGAQLRISAYDKEYESLLKTSPYNNSGSGYARGLEVYWREKNQLIQPLDFWISYSYIDTKRDYMYYPYQIQPNFVSPQTFSLVTKLFDPIHSIGISPTFRYGSPRNYYHFLWQDVPYGIASSGKTNAYSSLDLSVYHLFSMGKIFGTLFFQVTNLYNRNNVYNYKYALYSDRKYPMQSPANRSFFAALFLSFGSDRRQETIDNNL